MEVLFEDNFDTPGPLLSHVADTGQGWVNEASADQIVVGSGVVLRTPGSNSNFSFARVDETMNLSGTVELVADVEVAPGLTTGPVEFLVFVGNDDTGLGFSVEVANQGWCRVRSEGGFPPVQLQLSSGGETDFQSYTLRVVGTVGSATADLYANGILVGPFSLYAPLGGDIFVRISPSPNRTQDYNPLVAVSRIRVEGAGAEVGEFWTNIIRAAETP